MIRRIESATLITTSKEDRLAGSKMENLSGKKGRLSHLSAFPITDCDLLDLAFRSLEENRP